MPANRPVLPQIIRFLWKPVVAAFVVSLLWSSLVMVDETEYVLVERLGEIVEVYDRPTDRGLHFKLPWPVDLVRRFDRRVQLYDPPGREIFTRDRKNVIVDACLCWRIASSDASAARTGKAAKKTDEAATDDSPGAGPDGRPVVQFFRSLGSAQIAETRLDSRLRSILSTQLGQVELSELLHVEDSESGPKTSAPGPLQELASRIHEALVRRSDEDESLASRLGIEIIDVQIKRLNLPTGNQQAVFERMKSERRKIADRYRSAGMAENQRIRSRADRQYSDLLAHARADAERIQGAAEAEAIATLNSAHATDPEFYRVLRTLDTYRKILTERTTLVLSASSPMLRMLTEGIELPSASQETAPVAPPADTAKEATREEPEDREETKSSDAATTGAATSGTAEPPGPVEAVRPEAAPVRRKEESAGKESAGVETSGEPSSAPATLKSAVTPTDPKQVRAVP